MLEGLVLDDMFGLSCIENTCGVDKCSVFMLSGRETAIAAECEDAGRLGQIS